jgi:hypothetical protein
MSLKNVLVKAGQTGPTSAEGKKVAAKNALKSGAYSASLLPGESPQDVEDVTQGLMAQYGLDCALGFIKARSAAMSLLQIKRVEGYMANQGLAVMDSKAVREIFCERVGISSELVAHVPEGYFLEGDQFSKEAKYYMDVLKEAQKLHDANSPDLMQKVRTEFPNLWLYVMGDKAVARGDFNFGLKLGAIYKQSQPALCLRLLMKQVEDDCTYELLWARNEGRYESVMSGLRSELLMAIHSEDKIHRTLSRLNKQLDSEFLWLERLASQKAQTLVIEEQSGLDSKEQGMQMIDA